MKLHLPALLAAAIITLTACGGGSTEAAPQPSPSTVSAKPSPSKTSKPVPDVTGMKFEKARAAMNDAGYYLRALDKNGERWNNIVPDDSIIAVSQKTAPGSVSKEEFIEVTVNTTQQEHMAAIKAAADEKAIGTRYTYTCGMWSSTQPTYKSYKEVWASSDYKFGSDCSVKIGGTYPSDKPTLIPTEQKLVDFVASKGGDVSGPGYTVGNIMKLCAKVASDYADQALTPARKAEAEAALSVCPDAPHAAVLQEAVTAIKITDGNKIVGQTMEPGSWKTKPAIKDCYWSRNTGGGDIIANDFVGFAPDGVTVTVYAGEGFESSRCGTWTKIG